MPLNAYRRSVSSSDRTDLSTGSGSGPIQLARDRYRTACRSVAAALYECAAARTHGPLSSAVKLWGGRSLIDRWTGAVGGAATHAVARSPNGDVDRNGINIVS